MKNIRKSSNKKMDKYVTKPIVDRGEKHLYWKVRFIKRYPYIDNFPIDGSIGTTTEYIITKYFRFVECVSAWSIRKRFNLDRWENHRGFIVPIEYEIVSIDWITSDIWKSGVYFKSDDWTQYITEEPRSLEEWSRIDGGDMSIISRLKESI